MTEIKQDIVRDLMRVAYAWADEPVCPVSGRSGALEIAIRDALRAGKSQPVEQGEAVAPFCMHWVDRWGCNHYADQKEPHPENSTPLFTHPVRPMSDEQIDAIPFTGFIPVSERGHSETEALRIFARLVEAHIK